MVHLPRHLAAFLFVSAVTPICAAEEGHHWSYSGKTGPTHWAGMEKENESCGIGRMQSPIDIHTKKAKVSDLPAIAFDYKPGPLKVIDNGHTVQVNYPAGSSITVDGARYDLVQFHFHKPSEEKIDGKASAMVAHLVHRNGEGKLAVVAVLLNAGTDNEVVKTVWANVPKEKGREASVDSATIDVSKLLPADRGYYTFEGSLTTPPCSEGVRWFVLKKPVTISKEEIAAFGKLYPTNARPVQPLNGREVRASR